MKPIEAETKRCSRCDRFQSLASFTKAANNPDGLNYWCKECTRENSRQGYHRDPTKRREINNAYRQTERGKLVSSGSMERWVSNNPKKHIAHLALRQAVAKGVLTVPSQCEACHFEVPVQGHHWNYDLVFDVRWLCPQCHKNAHKEPEHD